VKESLYSVLGVERDASTETITAAYRALAKLVHPDQGGDTERFKAVLEAYRVLSDSEAREHYDRHGSAPEDRPELDLEPKAAKKIISLLTGRTH